MKPQVVSFHCVLKDKMGRVISSTYNRDVLTYDEKQKHVMPGLARGLQDLKKGDKRRIVVNAREAYGYYDPSRVLHCSLENVGRKHRLRLGQHVQHEGQLYRVTEIQPDSLTLDANHPLAGQDLVFEIEATDARPATPDDM